MEKIYLIMQIKVRSSWFISFFLVNGKDFVTIPRQDPFSIWAYNYSSSSYRAFIKNIVLLLLKPPWWDYLVDINTLVESFSVVSILSDIFRYIPEDISYFKRSITMFLYWFTLLKEVKKHFFLDNLKWSIYCKMNFEKTLFYYRKSKYYY